MDNLSSHKVKGVSERIEAAGAELLYCRLFADLNQSKSVVQTQAAAPIR